MFRSKELLQIVTLMTIQVIAQDTDYCYTFDKNPYLKFATRTPYEFVRGGESPYGIIPHCRPIQIWMLIRHGIKYPEADKVQPMKNLEKYRDEIIENHEQRGRGRLCDADLNNLKLWHIDPAVQLENADLLTEYGANELEQLGKRIRTNFPELFPPFVNEVSSANYQFRTANEDRMKSSQNAFMLGVLDGIEVPEVEAPGNETLFAGYLNCSRWVTEVAGNPKVIKELTKFEGGPEYQSMVYNISQRLGFLHNITADSIQLMWNMCRFDKALKIRDLSPWCAVFSKADLEVLEYREDIKDYHQRGYGHEFNIRLGCPLRRDLFKSFRELESGAHSSEPKGVFNSVRSGSLHLFMAAMGLAKDSMPLLASGFNSRNQRHWRTSEIGSFAANVAAVFYKCEDARSPHKVVFYLAERMVHYDGCAGGICDWEYLKNKFSNATLDCNSDFCFADSSDIRPRRLLELILVGVTMFIVF